MTTKFLRRSTTIPHINLQLRPLKRHSKNQLQERLIGTKLKKCLTFVNESKSHFHISLSVSNSVKLCFWPLNWNKAHEKAKKSSIIF